jgi:hypothetical protein
VALISPGERSSVDHGRGVGHAAAMDTAGCLRLFTGMAIAILVIALGLIALL